MPQPLSRVAPNAIVVIGNAGERVLTQRRELAILAIEAIASSSNVDSFLLRLFARLLGGNSAIASRIYLALEIQSAKSVALVEAVKALQNSKLEILVNAVIAVSKTNQKARDKLAHHVWGISPQLPDALLLADPKAFVVAGSSYDDIFVYRVNDLQSIIDANDRLCLYGLQLLWILNDHPANKDGQLYDELCNRPEIRERLDRQASQDQSAQAESP